MYVKLWFWSPLLVVPLCMFLSISSSLLTYPSNAIHILLRFLQNTKTSWSKLKLIKGERVNEKDNVRHCTYIETAWIHGPLQNGPLSQLPTHHFKKELVIYLKDREICLPSLGHFPNGCNIWDHARLMPGVKSWVSDMGERNSVWAIVCWFPGMLARNWLRSRAAGSWVSISSKGCECHRACPCQ